VAGTPTTATRGNEAVLASWHHLIDSGSLLAGDTHLAGTARPPVVRLGKALARNLGVSDGDRVTVGTERGAITLPAAVTEMADRVVWVPTNSPGSTVRRTLGVAPGAVVTVSAGGANDGGAQ
jgi:NADH-quinone oxidoreductase subunit G